MASKRTPASPIVAALLALLPLCGESQVDAPDKYEFSELTEVDLLVSEGPVNRAELTDFRRAFYIDERLFVIQRQDTRRYYLGVLQEAHNFSGACARRPQTVRRVGGTAFLMCGSKAIAIAHFYLFDDRQQMREVTSPLSQ